MELATVVGSCTATLKDESLSGRKLALVQRVDPGGNTLGAVEVALDVTGAGPGSTVLLVRGSAARQPRANRQLPADLAVVAIIDHLDLTQPAERTTGAPARRANKSTASKSTRR